MKEDWDEYFLDMCNTVSNNSKCLSRHYGALIVRDNSIISTGYNGPAKHVPHCNVRHKYDYELLQKLKGNDPNFDSLSELTTCPRYLLGAQSGEMLELCVAGHAERSSIVNAAKYGIAVNGADMYMNCAIPCTPCLVEIINAGIREIIVVEKKFYDYSGPYVLENSDLKCRTYKHIM